MKALLVVCAIALSGCAVGPDFKAPAAPDSQTYTPRALPERTVSSDGPNGASQTFDTARGVMP
ncbi:ABC transporter permease, partial [Mesorhizobium sp. M1C.F.Ca.ET.176.01.1.1]